MKPFVTKLPPGKASLLRATLEEEGFSFHDAAYAHFCAKRKGVSCTLYESGKLVVMGKDQDDFIEFVLEPKVLETFTYKQPKERPPPHIGVDESGKGDFFGPLCIAGVFADEEGMALMEEKGICDSKKMTDPKILMLSRWIKQTFPHHIVRLTPKKYNELYGQFRNLNSLLAWGHATVLANLAEATGCTTAWVDQFAAPHVVEQALAKKGITLDLTQRHRAEEDPVVAAASILARAAFVEDLEELERAYGVRLPKGASAKTILAGKTFLRTHGEENLPNVAKEHFKTLDAIRDNR